MLSTKLLRLATSVAVVGLVGLSSGLVDVTPASAAPTPRLFVTPYLNLHNGERVAVRGTGYTPGITVYVVECLVSAKGANSCNILHAVPATITKTGLLPRTFFTVSTGKVGTGKSARYCGTNAHNLKLCDVSAGNATGSDSAIKPIVFRSVKK